MPTIRSKLATGAAIAAAAVGGGAIANAATSGTASSPAGSSTHDDHGRHTVNGKTEQALTGGVAAKVKAAALGKVSGTVERVETNVDSDAPYEAHIRKADESELEVQINKDFTVAAVNDMGGMHR